MWYILCISLAKSTCSRKKAAVTGRLDFNWRNKRMKCYIWSIALYGAETWILRRLHQKYFKSFEMCSWTRTERIGWIDRVKYEEVLQRVKEETTILHTIRRRLTGFFICCVGTKPRYWKKDTSDGKTRKKTHAANGWPYGRQTILKIESGSTRSQSLENSLWKRLWSCRTDCGMDEWSFPIRCSIRHGCPLSMLLFALVLNPLLYLLDQNLMGIRTGHRITKTAVVA